MYIIISILHIFLKLISKTVIIAFIFGKDIIFSQPLLNHGFDYKLKKIIYDAGQNWDQLSSIGYEKHSFHEETMQSKYKIGFLEFNKYQSLYGTGRLIFKNRFFAYLDSKIFPSYNNRNIRYIDRQKEIFSSGIGYRNDWVLLQLGKGRENWGAGSDICLALSDNSAPFNYIKLASDYGSIRVNYIHGFLERTSNGSNRYINGRGIEWTNKKSAVISISEIIIYSGYNRSLDYSYLNPISSHLELELNNRLNVLGNLNSNAVWQIHLDFRFNKRSRLSMNYLFDEFVIDPEIEIGKEHGRAYSIKYAFNILSKEKNIVNVFFTKTLIGTPTFRHGLGTNNFVNDGKPLGWIFGSDGRNIKIGTSFSRKEKMLGEIYFGLLETGEETINDRPLEPYKDYLKSSFPSGEKTQDLIFSAIFQRKLNKIFFINFNFNLIKPLSKGPFLPNYGLNILFSFN